MPFEPRTCQNCQNPFSIEPEDFEFYEKIKVPPPTWCPECRYRRRLLDRNEWSLYRRKCDLTGEAIISIYREDAPFPVYKQEVWRSDAWDPLAYDRDFDFSRSFFEQYHELRQVVQHLALVNSNSVNSEYSNQSQDNKDCYWVSATGGSEKCMYGNWFQPGSYFSADCYMIEKSEQCYECINCGKCHTCVWCEDCFDCDSMDFSIDCIGCSNCFGCIGLRNKRYHYFNQPISKEEYEKRVAEFDWSRESIARVREKLAERAIKFPRKYYHGRKINRSSGDYVMNTEDLRSAFNCRETEDCAYLQDAWRMKDCLDSTEILQAERSYELQGCAYTSNSVALRSCWTMSFCYYCDMCFSCDNRFGCFGLRQKQYCILNKQYSKEEYARLKDRIIAHMKETGEWGEYFPPQHSPFAYNESVAQDFFPLIRTKAQASDYPWYDRPAKEYKFTMRASGLPNKISETDDSILNHVIRCSSQDSEAEQTGHPSCTVAFRLIPLELALYRTLNIPVPTKCFPCRRTDRFARRNPRRLWKRVCGCIGMGSRNGNYQNVSSHFHGSDHCPNEFETSYAPDWKEIVYCESCYQSEVA